jgi:hypothetical protein
MRKILVMVVGLMAAASLVMAQAPKSETKKPVKATIVLASDVKFGDQLLRAGEYQVKCDGETIEFTQATNRDRAAQTFKFPCKGDELSAPSDRTQLSTTTDATGTAVAQRLLLKGSNVQHIFS